MIDHGELHKFYEANLPEYQRKDLIAVTKFFVGLLKWDIKHPLKALSGQRWKQFREFVSVDWQGQAIQTRAPEAEPDLGRCSCGGKWVKRQNREKQNFFLGCSRYPKCKNTQNLL